MNENITARIDALVVEISMALNPVASAFIPILSDLKQEIMERDYRINLLQNSATERDKVTERQLQDTYQEGYENGYRDGSEDAAGSAYC